MFNTKPTRLGGVNDIFGAKYVIPDDYPRVVLRYDDAVTGTCMPSPDDVVSLLDADNTKPDAPPQDARLLLTLANLDKCFAHYMSAGLVLLKNLAAAHGTSNVASSVITLREDMLAKLRSWLTYVASKSELPLYDPTTKQKFAKKVCYYVENEEYMMIPRALALTLFGPSVWLPRTPADKFRDHQSAGALAPPKNAFDMLIKNRLAQEAAMAPPRTSERWTWRWPTSTEVVTAGVNGETTTTPHSTVAYSFDQHPFFADMYKEMSSRATPPTAATAANGITKTSKKRKRGDAEVGQQDDADDDLIEFTVPKACAATAAAATDAKPKWSGRIRLNKMEPSAPVTNQLPMAVLQVPTLHEEREVSQQQHGQTLLPSMFVNHERSKISIHTKALHYSGSLRLVKAEENGVVKIIGDQFRIVVAVILQMRRAFLPPTSPVTTVAQLTAPQPPQQTVPSVTVSVSCGVGKTRMSIVSWLWCTMSCFDHLTWDDLNDMDTPLPGIDEAMREGNFYAPRKTVKALFLVRTDALMRQAAKAIANAVPGVRIDMLRANKPPNPVDVDIVIVSTDTIAARHDFDVAWFNHFPLIISDEAHENDRPFFLRAMFKTPSPYRLCLTATPRSPFLPALLGGILVYLKVPVVMDCSMIAYCLENRPGRILKQKGVDGNDKADRQAEVADLVNDIRRNAWLVHLHMGACILGKLPQSHPSRHLSDEFMTRHVWDPLGTGKVARLYHITNANSASQLLTQATQWMPLPVTATASAMSAPPTRNVTAAPAKHTASARTTAAAATASSSASFMNEWRAMAQLTPPVGFAPVVSNAHEGGREARDEDGIFPFGGETGRPYTVHKQHVDMSWNPVLQPPCPIFFSQSVAHLVMHQHWHAQYWIDSCTSVPRQQLMLVRLNVRQLAVLDVAKLTAEQKRRIRWLSTSANQSLSLSGVMTRTPVENVDSWVLGPSPFDLGVGGGGGAQRMHDFGALFWRAWLDMWPINAKHAKESNTTFRNQPPESKMFPSKTSAKKVSAAKITYSSVAAAGGAKTCTTTTGTLASRMNAALGMAASAHSITSPLSNPPIASTAISVPLAAATVASSLTAKRPKKQSTSCINIITTPPTTPPVYGPNSPVMFPTWKPNTMAFAEWTHFAAYFMTPLVVPMPSVTTKPPPEEEEAVRIATIDVDDAEGKKKPSKPKKAKASPAARLWRSERFENDDRANWPVLATFGLFVGADHEMPHIADVLPKCSSIHNEDALKSDFCYTTYQIASMGIDKPPLGLLTQGIPNKDDEQCDGRCLRQMDDKQRVAKLEVLETQGCFRNLAYTHGNVYRQNKVRPVYYAIAFEDVVQ